MGRRLGALTRENTKCMVSVCGERLIAPPYWDAV